MYGETILNFSWEAISFKYCKIRLRSKYLFATSDLKEIVLGLKLKKKTTQKTRVNIENDVRFIFSKYKGYFCCLILWQISLPFNTSDTEIRALNN